MIDRIYNTLKFFTNQQVHGNVEPTDFNIALHHTILRRFDQLLKLLNNAEIRENKGVVSGGNYDLPKEIREKINYYLSNAVLTPVDDPESNDPQTFALSTDCRFIDFIINKDNGRPVQYAKNAQHFELINIVKDTEPTTAFPIGQKQGGNLLVFPNTIQEIKLIYLREPVAPNWTYTVVSSGGKDYELFNSGDVMFQDADVHISEEAEITLMMLSAFGIHLKEFEYLQAINSEEMKKFQKENSL